MNCTPNNSEKMNIQRELNRWTRGIAALCIALASAICVSGASAQTKKPNILVIWGDDIGTWNTSYWSRGMMGFRTPNIDRIAREGVALPTITVSRAARPAVPRSSAAMCPFAPA
jgi:hypothetical protein